MIRMRMVRLLLGDPGLPARMVLMDQDQKQALVAALGDEETAALLASFGRLPRPDCHDVLAQVVGRLGGRMQRALIHDLRGEHLIAEIELQTAHGIAEIDCRPGDAVAAALRAGCDVLVAEAVLAQTGMPATLFRTSS